MNPDPEPGPRAGLGWALASIVLWGTLAAAVGDALKGVPAAALVLWSFVFAAPTLVGWELARGRKPRDFLRARWDVVALGLWGIFGYHALLFAALERAPIVEANLLNYLWPLLMVLLAPVLGRERLLPSAVAGALAGFAGAALVVTQGKWIVPAREAMFGYVLALAAAIAWSSFSVLLRRAGAAGANRMTLFTVCALPAAFALAAARGELAPPPGRALLAAAWLGIGPMALAFVCWDRAMARGSAARIGVLSYLDPLLSTLCVAAVLGSALTGATWIGMALIVGGAALPTLLSWRSRSQGTSMVPK